MSRLDWGEDGETFIDPWPAGSPDVTEADNPVIGVILGPNGDPLAVLRERRTIRFGYQR